MSITISLSKKKSAPKMGRFTVVIQKVWKVLCPGANEIAIRRLPNVLIADPLAATSSVVGGRDRSMLEAGKTHSSAPESTKKRCPEMRSLMEMVPVDKPAAAISGRFCRFPGRLKAVWRLCPSLGNSRSGKRKRWIRTSGGGSRGCLDAC